VKLFHRHRWQIVATEQLEYQHLFRRGPRAGQSVGEPEPITEVLQRCSECGQVSTTTLDGHWTLADMEGRNVA
jgi:hypothetical protein